MEIRRARCSTTEERRDDEPKPSKQRCRKTPYHSLRCATASDALAICTCAAERGMHMKPAAAPTAFPQLTDTPVLPCTTSKGVRRTVSTFIMNSGGCN